MGKGEENHEKSGLLSCSVAEGQCPEQVTGRDTALGALPALVVFL